MNMFDLVSNVYDADLLIAVHDYDSLEKEYGTEEEDEEKEYFRRFVKIVMAG
jgi:lysyl-tRNA synthetase class I